MRRELFAAFVAGAITTLVAAPAASGAVAFIDQQPVALQLGEGSAAHVELFNGSPREQTLSLRVLGGPATELDVTKPAKAPPGGTRTFTVTLISTRTEAATATLLATSTDGTSTRLALHLGEQPPARDVPKTLDAGVAYVKKAQSITVADLPADTAKADVGTLYRTGGQSVGVTVDKQSLTIDAAPREGSYSGQIDVNGAAPGGVSTLTLKVRDRMILPLVVLLLGIGVGYLVEWWLSRLRPRSLLDRRLGRLITRLERRRESVDGSLARLFQECRPDPGDASPWQLPRAATTDRQGDAFYFNRVGEDLTRDLRAARTDPERDLFGPDGDRFKALQTDAELYAALIGDLREAAFVARGAFNALKSEPRVAMRQRFDREYGRFTIGDHDTLAARREAAKALRTAADQFSDYYWRLDAARELAANADLPARLEAHEKLLIETFRGEDGQVSWWDDALPKLESQLHVAPKEQVTRVALAVSTPPQTRRVTHRRSMRDEPAEPRTTVTNEPPWTAGRGTLRGGNFTVAEWVVGAISLILIAATGMSTLYLADETFGSVDDYLSLALWGSTATAALALLRRLFPGALKTAQGGAG